MDLKSMDLNKSMDLKSMVHELSNAPVHGFKIHGFKKIHGF
jgi:hypothetical protein